MDWGWTFWFFARKTFYSESTTVSVRWECEIEDFVTYLQCSTPFLCGSTAFLSTMKRCCRAEISRCLLRLSLCELLIVCQQFGGTSASADSCRSERPAVVDVLPSPVTSLRDEKSKFDVSAASVAQFYGHFAKRSPVRGVEGLLCTVSDSLWYWRWTEKETAFSVAP